MSDQLTLAARVELEAEHFLAANPGAEDFICRVALEDLEQRLDQESLRQPVSGPRHDAA